MLKKIIIVFILISSTLLAENSSKLDQFVNVLKQLAEEKQKMNPYQQVMPAQQEEKEPSIQEKMMQEQEIHQYIEMKQKYDPVIIGDKIDIAIKSLKNIKKHMLVENEVELFFDNSYSIGNNRYFYINHNRLNYAIAKLKNSKDTISTVDMLIDRLTILKDAIKNNKSLIINEEIDSLLRNITELYQNRYLKLTAQQSVIANNQQMDYGKNIKINIDRSFPYDIKIKKVYSNSIILGF